MDKGTYSPPRAENALSGFAPSTTMRVGSPRLSCVAECYKIQCESRMLQKYSAGKRAVSPRARLRAVAKLTAEATAPREHVTIDCEKKDA